MIDSNSDRVFRHEPTNVSLAFFNLQTVPYEQLAIANCRTKSIEYLAG